MNQPNQAIELSVVLPTFNAPELTRRSANELDDHLQRSGISFEIVIVDDGSAIDKRPEESELGQCCRLVRLDTNRGKGFAVRTGLLAASGRYRVFTDVDIPYGVGSIVDCYDAMRKGSDFVFGDRSVQGSKIAVPQSLKRRLSSAIFRRVVMSIVDLPTRDTQCGVKGMTGYTAERIVPLLTIDGFAFDVEILRCAIENDIRLTPIPVRLVNEEISTVRLMRDSVSMLRDLFAINVRAANGEYQIQPARPDAASPSAVGRVI